MSIQSKKIKKIRNDYESYQILSWIQNEMISGNKIDLSNLNYVSTDMAAILGGILEQNLNTYKNKNLLGISFDLLEELNSRTEVTDSLVEITKPARKLFKKNPNLQNRPENLKYLTKFKHFNSDQKTEFADHVALGFHDIVNIFFAMTKPARSRIERSLEEIFQNARTHGQTDKIFCCGSLTVDKEDFSLSYVICDFGKTIKAEVNSFVEEDLSGIDSIKWAIKKHHTTKSEETSGGLGLNSVLEFVKITSGNLKIVSSDGYYEYNGFEIEKELDKPFNGTIVSIKFDMNRNDEMLLIAKIEDHFEVISLEDIDKIEGEL